MLCSPENKRLITMCFEYEGKVIDASKERSFFFFFFFEVQRTDWRRFLNLLTDFCRDDDFQQPKGSRQGDQHPSSIPSLFLAAPGTSRALACEGSRKGFTDSHGPKQNINPMGGLPAHQSQTLASLRRY